MCGKLNQSMYGTRDAAQNCGEEYTSFHTSIGLRKGRASPYAFFNKERNIRVLVNGDDFTTLGLSGQLDWFRSTISERYEVKFRRGK